MGRKLSTLFVALKDKVSLSKAAALSCSSGDAAAAAADFSVSPGVAVLRATAHLPPLEPPNPKYIDALLSLGSAPRPAAAAAVRSLSSRLAATADASVALKCLLVAHYLFSSGAFILQDQLSAALLPTAAGARRRNPLNLSSFRDSSTPESWNLSSWVRWYARVLEHLFSTCQTMGKTNPEDDEPDRAASLTTHELLKETESLVALLETICFTPDADGGALVREVQKLVLKEQFKAEHRILVRVKEMSQRVESARFADWLEFLCMFRRLDRCMVEEFGNNKEDRPNLISKVRERFWDDIREVEKKAEEVVGEMEEEERERGRRVRRERIGESTRVMSRGFLGPAEPVRFGSSRWVER